MNGECIYCRKSKVLTDEHLVPKCLFLNDHKIMVPACLKCNNDKSKDDEYFKLVMCVLKENENHRVIPILQESIIRSLKMPEKTSFKDMIERSADNNEILGDNFIIVRNGLKVHVPRVNHVIKSITKGLYYREKKEYIPLDYDVIGFFGVEDFDGKMIEYTEGFRRDLHSCEWNEIGEDNIFRYRFLFTSNDSSESVWEHEFYQGISCLSIVHKKY